MIGGGEKMCHKCFKCDEEINIICSECGGMYSEKRGHDCLDKEGYY